MPKLKQIFTSGILFIFPLLIIVFFLGKIWDFWKSLSGKLIEVLNLQGPAAAFGYSIFIVLILLLLILFFGLLFQISAVKNLNKKLDNFLITYVPLYSKYRIAMDEQIEKPEGYEVVLLQDDDKQRFALVTESSENEYVLFIPVLPDMYEGQVVVAPISACTPTGLHSADINAILYGKGKGILASKAVNQA